MQIFLPILVTFILSGLIGNRLLQAWQARTWLLQQQFLGHEKEYVALKELTDEIATLLGIRIYHMQRLTRTLANSSDKRIELQLQEYDDAVKRWNERLTSFYVRLPMLANYGFALQLENSIQARLVTASEKIERMRIRHAPTTTELGTLAQQIAKDLIAIQGRAIHFNKSLLSFVQSRRSDVYYGKRLPFSLQNIRHFSTWSLVKALFVRDVETLSVVRTPLDS